VLLLLLSLPALAAPEMIPLADFQAVQQAGVDPAAARAALPLREGGTFSLAAHQGQPVIMTFWASWCGPCQRELPALADWAKAHPEVAIVAINVDKERAPADRFLLRVHFDLPVAFDPDAQQRGSSAARRKRHAHHVPLRPQGRACLASHRLQ